MTGSRRPLGVVLVAVALIMAACASGSGSDSDSASGPTADSLASTESASETSALEPVEPTAPPTSAAPTTPAPASTTAAPPTTENPYERPAWFRSRVLTEWEKLNSMTIDTPVDYVDRRLETIDLLPPPAGDEFEFSVGPVPDLVAARSTWRPECPVALSDLVYITVSHFGFDERFHTGELIVNAAVADDVVTVFEAIHAARFPIEQMRVITLDELDEEPTGDWNDTTAFTCREATGAGNWSQHAFGLAIDINPFHNPYLKAGRVIPELAKFYTDRDSTLPGMVSRGDAVFEAFRSVGWGWGGDWYSLKDWMHFSRGGN
jgi:hypothetical protein